MEPQRKDYQEPIPPPIDTGDVNAVELAKWYTKLDIRGAYNLIRMAEVEEWKTTFQTRYGLFESLVMPFGLTNAPTSSQTYINETLVEFLDRFCSAFLNDTIVYSETYDEHVVHV